MKKIKKPLKTIEENSTWKNIKTINTITKKVSKNSVLEKLAEKWKLPWYETVKPKIIKPYLRSIKNKVKIDNLDPKIENIKSRKIIKKVIKKPN